MTDITQHICRHALDSPQRLAITYLHDDGTTEVATCADVVSRATAVASVLRRHAGSGSVACLAYPHRLDFVWAFLGCLFAGIVAVPCAPPAPRRNRSFSRLKAIVAHARPELILTTASVGAEWFTAVGETSRARVILTDSIPHSDGNQLEFKPDPSDTAFIQYTSGSTSNPKGVVITHRNLLANERAIQAAFEHDRQSTMISWLPMFHDMGLVGGVLQPLFVGFPTILLSPASFLAKPVRWLEAISRYRGTTTGAPNFAYDLCVKGISEAQKVGLDLSSLSIAYNGSEPVRAETIDRFSAAFASCGFRAEAFFPCYGMAEATLFVSGGPPLRAPRRLRVRRGEMERNRIARASDEDRDAIELVGSGTVARGTEIAIVDPQSLQRCEPATVGEIWIRSPGVGAGYFGEAEATAESFGAQLDAEQAPYLRTGDLGFLLDRDEVVVTGRLKDVIIVAGRNLYPQDIEACAAGALQLPPRVRCAAVSSRVDDDERVSIVVEANASLRALIGEGTRGPRGTQGDLQPTAIEDECARVRHAVLEEFGVLVDQVAFVRTGRLPTTTSGKIRRAACQALLASSDPDIVYVSRWPAAAAGPCAPSATWSRLKQMLAGLIKPEQRGAFDPTDERSASLTLDDLGVDSLGKVAFAAELERQFNIQLDPADGLRDVTLTQLVWRIDHAAQRPAPKSSLSNERLRHPLPAVDSRITSLTDFADRQSRDMLAKTLEFRSWLDDADARGFKRYLLPVIDQGHGRAIVEGIRQEGEREVILFASADYLGLAHDARVKRAAAEAIMAHGCNVASVPLIAGSTPVHKLLERGLSELVSTESCVLFPTGHSANMATIAALCSPHDTVVVDNRVHYSILEGARLAHCQWTTFLHNSPESLRDVLSSVRSTNDSRGVLVVLEGVYGIDGDLANLTELVEIARQFDARVMLDDAHGVGVLGPQGEGTAAHVGCPQAADIVMGSLSKALGSFGGFIAASQDTVDYLRFFAKAISFAVGLPGSNAAAALESLAIIRESPQRLAQLRNKARLFRDALIGEGFAECAVSQSTIMSIDVGEETLLRDMVRELFERGIWAEGLPFPAVSRGQERIRFRVRWDHAEEDLLRAASVVGSVHRRIVAGRTRGGHSSSQQRSGFQKLVVSQLTGQQLTELCDGCIHQAQQHELALPWISREFIAKYFARTSYWSETAAGRTWHLGYRSGKLVTAFQLDRVPVSIGGTTVRAALLGSLICDMGSEPYLQELMRDALERLQPDVECCIAPAAYPVQVFGCGLQTWRETNGKPFLETSYPGQLLAVCQGAGFHSGGTKSYRRVRLSTEPRTVESGAVSITIRDFRRPDFVAEIDRISPILDRTLGQLELCTPLPRNVLQGLIQDLRELVLPGLWLVAEADARTVGFAFCYPNLTAEFERIAGRADVADFQLLQQAMESSREAFLAWMAVDPDYAERGVAARLLHELQTRLVARGCTHAWVSWEVVDGKSSSEELAQRLGHIVQVVEMPYLALAVGRGRNSSIVPQAHFANRLLRDHTQIQPR